MAYQGVPLSKFARGDYVFTVHRDGEVHLVEARNGGSAPIPVCHIYNPHTSPGWLSGWFLDSWRPWIERQAHRVITEATAAEGDRVSDDSAQPDHIPQ
jgi:hypothetical protein